MYFSWPIPKILEIIALVLFGRVEYVEMNTCVNCGAIPISNDWVMAKNVNSDEKFTISQRQSSKKDFEHFCDCTDKI